MPVLRYRCHCRDESADAPVDATYLTMRITAQGKITAVRSNRHFIEEVSKRVCDKGEVEVLRVCRAIVESCEVLSVEI